MKRRLLWTIPALLVGAAVGFLWAVVWIYVNSTPALPPPTFGQIGMLVGVILLPGWLLIVLPLVLIFKESARVYSLRIAPWLGAACGLGAFFLIAIGIAIAGNDFGGFALFADPRFLPRILVMLSGPLLVGAAFGTTLGLCRRHDSSITP